MNAPVNSSLNGGSGGLEGGAQNISVGAGGLKAPADQQQKRWRKILFAVVILAAVKTVAAERDKNF